MGIATNDGLLAHLPWNFGSVQNEEEAGLFFF